MQDSSHGTAQLDPIDHALIDSLRQRPSGLSARELIASLKARGYSISQSTLSRRLAQLASQRHLIPHKAGRSTVYARDPYHDWFSLPPTRRPKVPYNFEVLAGYEPNRTRWLTPEQTARLI